MLERTGDRGVTLGASRVFAFFRHLFRRRATSAPPAIVLDDAGFTLAGHGSLRWHEVTRIVAYKADLLTTDEILVALEYRGPGDAPMTFLVSEECAGFVDFMETLGQRFPSVPPDWYFRVMQPAFAPNTTELFVREPEHPSA